MSESKEEERLLRAVTKGKPSQAKLVTPKNLIDVNEATDKKKNTTSIVGRTRDVLDDIRSAINELKAHEQQLVESLEERVRSLTGLHEELRSLEHQVSHQKTLDVGSSQKPNPPKDFDLDSLLDDLTGNLEEEKRQKVEAEQRREEERKETEIKHKEEQRREEERREDERKEAETRRKEEQRKEEERKEEERREERRKEEKRREDEKRKKEEDAKRREDETKKKEEEKRKHMELLVKNKVPVAAEPKPIELSPEEAKEAEEVRLLRAIKSRGKKGSPQVNASITTPDIIPESTPTAKTANNPGTTEKKAWKDKRQQMEEERKNRAMELEEAKRKEQEQKRLQEEKVKQEAEALQRAISSRDGVPKTFACDGLYDFDATVLICGSLTGGKEIPVPLDATAMEFKITLPVPPGLHFYRFKVDGKWVVDKKKPTGLDPSVSEVSNKIEV